MVVLHFHLQCLAEAERDNENFGAIFEHMYELYMQQPQGHVRPRGITFTMEEKAENPSILRMMRVRMMMRQMVRAKVLAQKRTRREQSQSTPYLYCIPTVRGRERNPEGADPHGPHDTETMDVQRTMEESSESLQRALQILRMRYDHAVLQKRMEEARELAMEITRLEGFQSFV